MKARFFPNIMISVAIIAFFSCSKEPFGTNIDQPADSPRLGKVVFKVGGGLDTKTYFATDGKTINWTVGDEVAVYDGTDVHRDFKVTSAFGSSAVIEGIADIDATDYYAIYPASALLDNEGSKFKFAIPSEQDLVSYKEGEVTYGTFDPKANISVAHATQDADGVISNMTFKNVGLWLKLRLGTTSIKDIEEKAIQNTGSSTTKQYTVARTTLDASTATVSKMRVVSQADYPLSGKFYVDVAEADKTDGALSLTPVEGQTFGAVYISEEGTIAKDEWYYVCVAPAAVTGTKFSLSFTITCDAVRQEYSYGGAKYGSPKSFTPTISASISATAKKDWERDNIYTTTIDNVTLIPDDIYSDLMGSDSTLDDDWDGNYIAVATYGGESYAMINSTCYYYDSYGNELSESSKNDATYWGYKTMVVTQYYDPDTKSYVIPKSAIDALGNDKYGDKQFLQLRFEDGSKRTDGLYNVTFDGADGFIEKAQDPDYFWFGFRQTTTSYGRRTTTTYNYFFYRTSLGIFYQPAGSVRYSAEPSDYSDAIPCKFYKFTIKE